MSDFLLDVQGLNRPDSLRQTSVTPLFGSTAPHTKGHNDHHNDDHGYQIEIKYHIFVLIRVHRSDLYCVAGNADIFYDVGDESVRFGFYVSDGKVERWEGKSGVFKKL